MNRKKPTGNPYSRERGFGAGGHNSRPSGSASLSGAMRISLVKCIHCMIHLNGPDGASMRPYSWEERRVEGWGVSTVVGFQEDSLTVCCGGGTSGH